jgi:hypothetical protein
MYQADLWHSHHWIDIRDWLGAITTALAAGFAAYAIWQSKRQAEKSNQALIAERRADYALDILRDLAEFVSKDGSVAGRNETVKLLLQLSPARIPTARAQFGVNPTEHDYAAYSELIAKGRAMNQSGQTIGLTVDDVTRPVILAEIKDAIDEELARRPGALETLPSITAVSVARK